jgi:hypothetical protein
MPDSSYYNAPWEGWKCSIEKKKKKVVTVTGWTFEL